MSGHAAVCQFVPGSSSSASSAVQDNLDCSAPSEFTAHLRSSTDMNGLADLHVQCDCLIVSALLSLWPQP
jgi:hypothetical protein